MAYIYGKAVYRCDKENESEYSKHGVHGKNRKPQYIPRAAGGGAIRKKTVKKLVLFHDHLKRMYHYTLTYRYMQESLVR